MKKLFFMLTTIMLLSRTNAGQESHGGNVVKCDNQETVTLDYYNAALPTVGGPADIVDLKNWNEDEVIQFIRSRLANSLFLELFDDTMHKFGAMDGWPLANLKDVDDGGEPYFLPGTCTRVTAAVRQDNTIYIDFNVFQLLSPAQRGILYVHEMLYYISGQNSSTPVREMLRIFLKKNPSFSDIIKATQYVGPYYDYQFIKDQKSFQLSEAGFGKQVLTINGAFQKNEIKYVSIGSATEGNSLILTHETWLDCGLKTSCRMDVTIYTGKPTAPQTCAVSFPDLKHLVLLCSTQTFRLTAID